MKTLADIHREKIAEYKTQNNTYKDFPFSTHVKVITPFQDMHFFYGETGIVEKSENKYLGIAVKFDKPRVFKNGMIQKRFNFNPQDLVRMPFVKNLRICPHCGHGL